MLNEPQAVGSNILVMSLRLDVMRVESPTKGLFLFSLVEDRNVLK